jgi:hypothetical protein
METDIFIYTEDDAEETLVIEFDFQDGHPGRIGSSPDFDIVPEQSEVSIVSVKWASTGKELTKDERDLYITDLIMDELKERGQDEVDGIPSRYADAKYDEWKDQQCEREDDK